MSSADVTPGVGGDLTVAAPAGSDDVEAMDGASSASPRSGDEKMSSTQGKKQQQQGVGRGDRLKKDMEVDGKAGGADNSGTMSPLHVKVQPDEATDVSSVP